MDEQRVTDRPAPPDCLPSSGTTRCLGVLGVLGALALVGGDLLFLSPGGNQSVVSARAQVPTTQVYVSGLLGVLGTWLYAVGSWHVLFGLRSTGRAVRAACSVSLAATVIATGIYHAVFPALMFGAQVAETTRENGAGAELALALPQGYTQLLLVLAVITPGAVFTVAFTWAVAAGATRYPRWIVVLNPIVLLTLLWLAERLIALTALELALGTYYGVLVNLGFALFFSASTALLWSG